LSRHDRDDLSITVSKGGKGKGEGRREKGGYKVAVGEDEAEGVLARLVDQAEDGVDARAIE